MKKKLFIVLALALIFCLALSTAALADTAITSVKIDSVSTVTLGERLGNYYKDYNNYSTYSFKTYKWASDSHRQYDSVINTETRAEAGEKYIYRLYLQPKAGYFFPGKSSEYDNQYFDGTLTVNGKTAQGWVEKNTGYLYFTSDWMSVPAAVTDITSVTFSGLEEPAVGKTCDQSVTVPSNAPYTVKSVAWQNNSTSWTTSSFTFEAGKQYQCRVTFEAKEGYTFPAGASIFGIRSYTGTITRTDNGKTHSGSVSSDGKTLMCWPFYTESLTQSIAITAQPQDQSAEVGGSVTFSVTASGSNLTYRWYTGTDASPMPIGDDKAQLTIKNLVAQNNGTSYWCVVSDGTTTVTSNKAKLTVTEGYVFPFTDVKPSDWFYNDVKIANKMGLIDGKTPTLFKPNDNMTYAEAIKLAACMSQYYHDGAITLAPKAASDWYQPYVDYARTHGIPWSFPNYNANITRADYVYIFYYALPASNYTNLNNLGLAQIPDVGPSTFASSEILALYNAGILRGSDNSSTGVKGYFKPDDNIKRSEVAAILTRMMDSTQRLKYSL